MPRRLRNLSISILKPSHNQDFCFDSSFDHESEPPMTAPPTTLDTNLFPVNEACESCDACTALVGTRECRSSHSRNPHFTNGLGSASSTRRRVCLEPGEPFSPTLRSFSSSSGSSSPRYGRHSTILPVRHRGSACNLPLSRHGVADDGHGGVIYDTPRSVSTSTDSTPVTTPVDERISSLIDGPLRSLSLGALSLGSTSTTNLSSGAPTTKSHSSRFRLLERSFF